MRQLRCGSGSAAELMEKNAWTLCLASFVSWGCHRALGYLGCDFHGSSEDVWETWECSAGKVLALETKRLGFDPKT